MCCEEATPASQNTTAENKLPPWLEDVNKKLAASVGTLADRQYEGYTGSRTADLSPQELQALAEASNSPWMADLDSQRAALAQAGNYTGGASRLLTDRPWLSRGVAASDLALTDPNAGRGLEMFNQPWMSGDMTAMQLAQLLPDIDINQYMNPYTDLAINPVLRQIEESQTRDLVNARRQAAAGGSFGNNRLGLVEGEIVGRSRQQASDVLGTGKARAYESALAAFQADRASRLGALGADRGFDLSRRGLGLEALSADRASFQGDRAARMAGLESDRGFDLAGRSQALGALEADRSGALNLASAYGGAANSRQGLYNARLNNLYTAGSLQRQDQQRRLDTSYQDFLQKRDYDYDKLNSLTTSLGRLVPGTGSSTTVMTGTPGTPAVGMMDIIGGLTSAVSAAAPFATGKG